MLKCAPTRIQQQSKTTLNLDFGNQMYSDKVTPAKI